MQSPGEIEDVKKKIYARTRKMLWHGIGNFFWASFSGQEKVGSPRKKLSRGEGRAEGQAKLLRARGLAELGKVASGSTTQSLWLRDQKVRSQVIGKTEANFLAKEQLGKLGEEENKEEEPVTERRIEYTDLGLDFGEREEQVACHASALALTMTDEARREEEM